MKTDGYQNLVVDGEPVVVLDRATLWYGDSSGALLRLWQQPMLSVQVERDQVLGITAEAGATCASWLKALAQMDPASPSPWFLTAPWHPDVVILPGDTAMMIACLPRRAGGNLLATIAYQGDMTAPDFAAAVTPLLSMIGAQFGALPSAAPYPATPPSPELDTTPSGRTSWDAYAAPSLLAMYERITPAIDGVAPSQGAAIGVELPAVGRRDRGGLAVEASGDIAPTVLTIPTPTC